MSKFIVYLHGFRSSPLGGKTQILEEMFPQHKVIGCDYFPHSPDKASQELLSVINKLLDDGVITNDLFIVGTSLGGFWAQWVSDRFGIRALSINPSLHPDDTLPSGIFSVFDQSGRQIEVSSKELTQFMDYKVGDESEHRSNCTVWLAKNVELLDSKATQNELFKKYSVRMFENGGHRFEQFIEMKEDLQSLIEQ
ncbi:MAG: hypothetical protein KUG78_15465 [Kangiellaceae bacterium]|nr:hypothetical protein [Kangiellaceae bacterium]